jgi:glycosyltransferase involved in cell wall biosynthesis
MSARSERVDVSIIIVNYETPRLVKECVESVICQSRDGVAFEVIIVDNHSADGSVHWLRQELTGVFVIESKENLGFGRANNLGVSRARGEYVFLLNSDTILLTDVVGQLYHYSGIQSLGTTHQKPSDLGKNAPVAIIVGISKIGPSHSAASYPYDKPAQGVHSDRLRFPASSPDKSAEQKPLQQNDRRHAASWKPVPLGIRTDARANSVASKPAMI